MEARQIREGIFWMGAVDWDRRLFDSLIPLPDGTSYNAYLVKGSSKTALLDTVDPSMYYQLQAQLASVERLDYVVAHHAEQDHSGSIAAVLDKRPEASVVCSPKCKPMLIELLHIAEERIVTADDGDAIDLGGRTLKFVHAPWVHWPETMLTYVPEDKILFTCDFLGSHLATSELYSTGRPREREAAKRYFAEIMMPFSNLIVKNLDKIEGLDVDIVAPSHGPVVSDPGYITDCYRQWSAGPMRNKVCVPYVSMHGSTRVMVDALVSALVTRGVAVERFELTGSDPGNVAMSLVDAATVVIGAPTVLGGAHPAAAHVALLANALRPRTKFVSVLCSYSWGGRAVEQISGLISNLRAEVLEPVVCKGLPRSQDLQAIERLADQIAENHRELGLV
ncbi:MAG: FprA family A-type flavoprotein [Firmicutes bacterium]|nr:FprA family A-type flavoprotein [Bacillota bacterium]